MCLQEVLLAPRIPSSADQNVTESPPKPLPKPHPPSTPEWSSNAVPVARSNEVPVAITAAASVCGALLLVLLVATMMWVRAHWHQRRVEVENASTQVHNALSCTMQPVWQLRVSQAAVRSGGQSPRPSVALRLEPVFIDMSTCKETSQGNG